MQAKTAASNNTEVTEELTPCAKREDTSGQFLEPQVSVSGSKAAVPSGSEWPRTPELIVGFETLERPGNVAETGVDYAQIESRNENAARRGSPVRE
jgi:hypothetical protein